MSPSRSYEGAYSGRKDISRYLTTPMLHACVRYAQTCHTRRIRSNGYFGGPLSSSLSSPLPHAPPPLPSVCLVLLVSALLFFFRVVHFSSCGARSPYHACRRRHWRFSRNYVEFTLHPRCIITGTCAMHARDATHRSAIHGSKAFK